MSGTVNRRVFVGSVAAGLPLAVGGYAAGVSSLFDQPVSAQPAAASPIVREIRRQLKHAIGKMKNGESAGARQLATTLRIYASTVDNGQLKAALRKANRQKLLQTEMNHGELVRHAEELGINPSTLPPHSIDRVGREVALDRLIKEGLSPSMLHVADFIDDVGAKMGALERSGRARPLQIALRQPIPEPVDCGNCDAIAGGLSFAEMQMTLACAVAIVAPLPPFVAACEAAVLAWLAMLAAYGACRAIVTLCEAYYN